MSGKLFIISAPSGAGKSTIISHVMKKLPFLKKLVSFTTRPIRSYEKDGLDYHFISEKDFLKRKGNGEFIEWANVHGNLYATSINAIKEGLENNDILIKDIDVQGAIQLEKVLKNKAIPIFIKAPSNKILEDRLVKRKSEDKKNINKRLETAKKELDLLEKTNIYKYTIINNNLDDAVNEVVKIIKEYVDDKSEANN